MCEIIWTSFFTVIRSGNVGLIPSVVECLSNDKKNMLVRIWQCVGLMQFISLITKASCISLRNLLRYSHWELIPHALLYVFGMTLQYYLIAFTHAICAILHRHIVLWIYTYIDDHYIVNIIIHHHHFTHVLVTWTFLETEKIIEKQYDWKGWNI